MSSTPFPIALIKLSPQMDSFLNLLASSVWTPNIFAALIGLPSALLYLLELFVLIKHWHRFKSSFFVFFLFRAIIALLNMSVNYVNQRFCKLGWFLSLYQNMPTWLLAIAYLFIYFPFHVENLANFFLLLNRYTSVAFVLRYEQIWSYRTTALCVFISCLLPLPFTLHILQYQVYTQVQNQSSSFILAYTQPQHLIDFTKSVPPPLSFMYKGNNLTAAVSSLLFMLICLVLNAFTLLAYKRHQQQNKQMMNSKERFERKMTVYALLTLAGQLAMSLYMIGWYMVSSFWKPQFDKYTYELTNLALQNQGPWINDLSTIALPAWLMLFANHRMRLAIERMFFDDTMLEALLQRVGIGRRRSLRTAVTVAPSPTTRWAQNQNQNSQLFTNRGNIIKTRALSSVN